MKNNYRALVINPWITDFKLYDEWMHPVGLYFLISLLKHNNWDVEYINCIERDNKLKPKKYNTGDFNYQIIEKPPVYNTIKRKYKRYGIDKNELIEKLKKLNKPDIVFVGTGMSYWVQGCIETCNIIRKIFPDTKMIIGGIAASLIPEYLEKYIPEAIIYTGTLSEKINKFITYKNLNFNNWNPSFIDAFSLIKHHYHGPVLTSLGCPFKCSYCASSKLQDKYYKRPLNIILNEIGYCIEKYNASDFAFYDDALLFNAENHFIPLIDTISSTFSGIRLHTPNGLHIKWLDSKILYKMRESGFTTIRFGYETGNDRFLKDIDSKTNKKQLTEKITLAVSAGFDKKNIGVYIMAGLPDQGVNDVLDEISFISSLNVMAKPVFLSPVPGTILGNIYEKMFPELSKNPFFQNDTFFITRLHGWNEDTVESIRQKAKKNNEMLL